MPIRIPDHLPAAKILESENIFVMTENRAHDQDIRPLQILILNLMPTKIETETQLLRLLGNTPLQVDIDLMQTATHISKNTAPEHLLEFYQTFDQVRDNKYDGMIITGAPGGDLGFHGGGLLGRAVRHHALVADPCIFHPAHLLGGPGGAVLPSPCAQVRAERKAVGDIQTPAAGHEPSAAAGVRRDVLHAPFAVHRGAPG